MSSDLDRAYVINGDDLRIALSKTCITIEEPEVSASVHGSDHGWQPLWAKGAPKFPAELAAELLKAVGEYREPEEADRDVVDAHIHCEHAPGSRASHELRIADQIVTLLGPNGYDGGRRVKRILRWVWDYLTDGDEPPF